MCLQSLQGLQVDAAYFYDQLINRFPGPVFSVLRNEAEAAATEIRGILDNLSKDYPNLQVQWPEFDISMLLHVPWACRCDCLSHVTVYTMHGHAIPTRHRVLCEDLSREWERTCHRSLGLIEMLGVAAYHPYQCRKCLTDKLLFCRCPLSSTMSRLCLKSCCLELRDP